MILEADRTAPVKQRHTAKRIFERLRDEHGYGGLHTADLTAFMLQDDPNCELLSLPAIAPNDEVIPLLNGKTYLRRAGEVLSPEREPLSVLEALKRQMGGTLFRVPFKTADPARAGI